MQAQAREVQRQQAFPAHLAQPQPDLRLIQVIQGAAVVSFILNAVAVWKQEIRNPALTAPDRKRPIFKDQWNLLMQQGRTVRLLVATGLGAGAFAMQDVLLEPYGAEVLGMDVGSTTAWT